MILNIVYIAAGGALGSVSRYLLSLLLNQCNIAPSIFPFSTLIINITGSLLIGVMTTHLLTLSEPEPSRLFLITGILGGYTTFSAFSLDTISLLQEEAYGLACLYVGLSVIGSLIATIIGLTLYKSIYS